jgi:DNA-binding FrmR family transcriptional regulator
MIDERRYCPEIIQQIRAATNALKGLEQEVLKGHLEGCVREAMESRDPFVVRNKVDEILKLWS